MKKSLTIIGGIIIICLIVFSSFKSCYNEMVTEQEKATTAWSNVQSAYQRRADLIPNLVETVKGYAKHEQGTLTEVINARAKATQITVDPENLTPEKLQEFQAAQGDLTSALGKLLAIQEAYPDLKANENFKDLQVQLEGTENRINEARNNFNTAVQNYNTLVRSFPKNIVAGLFGFDKMTKYEAEAGAQKAPEVKF
ncbi:MAG: LemA family protein [Prevotella sp.]|nr:LemA family protein [Prevotella sp.]